MSIFEDNNNSPFNKVSEFNKNSRAVWDELSSGSAFETDTPTCGLFSDEFYGESRNEGIDFVELVKFLHKNRVDKSLSFNYKSFAKPATVIYYENWVDEQDNTIPFSYKDENNIVRKARIFGKLNKRNCYLEDGYGYILNINPKKERINTTLRFYYENTRQYRQDYTKTLNTNDFTIDEKYVAISLSSSNLNDFVRLVKTIQGESSFARIKNTITKKYAKLLNEVKGSSEANFLYKNAPNFVLSELNKHVKKEQFFNHLDLLVKYDTEGVFSGWVDSSSSIVNLFKAIGNAEYLFEKFKDNPKLVKDIYWNLDGSSNVTVGFEDNAQEIEKRNRTIFSEFVLGLCYYNKLKGLEQKENTYFIGENYKFDSNVLRINDKEKDKFFLQQEIGRKETKTIYIPDDLPSYRERYTVEVTNFYPENEGEYYHPLDLVFLIDADSGNNIPMPVPSIFLKSISDEEEWKGINQSIRIGADILAIIIGVATLGTSSPLLLAAAAIDIGLATTDLLVAVSEDELMKTPEGQQFLEDWNKVSLFLGIAAGGTAIAAYRSTFLNGARLLAKATVETTQKFLRTALLKMVLEINISNFAKGTIKIIPYAEVSKVTKNVLSSSSTIKLQKVGVIFVEGEMQVANKTTQGIAAIYKGEVIAEGTSREVKNVVNELGKLNRSSLIESLESLFNRANLLGKILKTEDELKAFLGKIDNTFKAIELDKVGIKAFFRGTTKNTDSSFFQGNLSSKIGLSISTDPVRAIIFAIESATENQSKGFLQIGLTKNLKNINLNVPASRTRYLIELEVKLQTDVNSLSKLVKSIPVEKARTYINKKLNLDLGTKIYSRESFMLLDELPVTGLEESLIIYQELIKL